MFTVIEVDPISYKRQAM